MKTSSILLIVIALAIFALFFRLYQGKLNKLQNREDFQCKPKLGESKVTDRIDRTMRIYVNSSDPIVKGGVEKFTKSGHVKPMLKDLKNILSLYLSKYCNFEVKLMPESEENGVRVVNVSITDGVVTSEPENDSSGGDTVIETFQDFSGNSSDNLVKVNNFFEPLNQDFNIPEVKGTAECKYYLTKEKKLPSNLGNEVNLGFEFSVLDQGWGNTTTGILELVNITTQKSHQLATLSGRKQKGKDTPSLKKEIDISEYVKSSDTIQLKLRASYCKDGHKLTIKKLTGMNLSYESTSGSDTGSNVNKINNFFAPIDYSNSPHDCSENSSRPKTEEKKLPSSLGMGVKLQYEFKIQDQGWGNDTMGKMTLKNITTGKSHFLHQEKGRGNKTYKGEVTISSFVNPGDTIQLLFTESWCANGHVMKWHFIKNLNLIIVGEDDELLEDEENEEEYDEISLPYDDQIKKFCYDLKDCPYFFIDFNINITEKTIELLSYFSLKKINDDEGFLNLVELIGRGRNYNNVQIGMFKVIHLARTFFFSRKYSEVDIEAKCLKENFVSNTSIGETLNKELVVSEFDNSTLIEEYYSQKGQNLLFIKENIRNNLLKNCKDDSLKQFLIDNKNTMDLITNLDDNANLLKSMINMTGDYSGKNDKKIDKMASKWSEFHNIYKSQLEDIIIDKFKISDPDHRIERDTHKYRLNKYARELEKIKMSKNPNKGNYDKFYRNQLVSLQNQKDGTILNYSRVSEKGKFVDKYLIFANGGCLKNLGGKLEIEYDYNFQRNNPNLHFNFEIIENPKDYIAKMNYSFVDERRNRKFNMNEVPTVLISPVGMYGRVLKIENEKIFLENCNGDINERFRLRDLIESPCDFPEKEVN